MHEQKVKGRSTENKGKKRTAYGNLAFKKGEYQKQSITLNFLENETTLEENMTTSLYKLQVEKILTEKLAITGEKRKSE